MLMKPRFPVIDPKPSFTKTVANFNGEDYLQIGVTTAGGFAINVERFWMFWVPNKRRLPISSRVQFGLSCLALTSSWAYVHSAGKLMGYLPNYEEVIDYDIKKY